ncbi:MAG: hypothetical protein IPG45_07385 [Deltaproteobacteria bacterium]|jgi:hypothetical protein|nr:hypothetical protein [Deltaproteobacteria bacterium]
MALFSSGGIGNSGPRTNVNQGNSNLTVGDGNNINGDVGSNNTTFIINAAGGGDGSRSVQGADEGGGQFNPLDPLGLFAGLGGAFGGGGGGLLGCVAKCLSV